MANKMDEMRKDLEEITNQHKNFNLTEGPSANEPQVIDTRETSSIIETQIVGRNDDKENILACLVESMTKDITILPIYGIGGLGKTTLAKMIYNSSQFKDYSQVWVYVSQTFDLKKIGNSIITQLSDKKKESEYTGMEMIHKSLQKLLSDKKILIVLDDLWQGDQSHLESLVDMLRVGHKIVKDDLIHQWVSLGFCTWQHGETYIRELLGLSFLEHSMSSSVSTIKLDDEDITLLTMHDLVHDLARSVMDDEILVICKGNNADGRCYHYALLDDCSKPFGLELSKIRALRFTDCDKTELHDAAFSSAKSLRVLDLSECSIHKLPDSIGVLKHLRYLNAPSVQDAIIPNSITRLSRLIYLNLCGSCKILALPESIGEIAGLQYLNLSGCSGIEKLPESFGRLKALLHLDLSNCSCIGVSLPHFEVQPGNSDCSSNLVQLQQVDPEVLEISKLENVKCIGEAQRINLMDKNRLYDLKLEWTGDAMRFVDDKLLLEKLKPPSTLKELVICGYNGDSFPAWLVLDQLTNLERLVISGMANLEELNITYSSVEVEDHVLQSLVIHDCPKLRMNRLLPKAKQWMISNSDNVLSSWEECTLPYTSERSPEVIRHLSSLETLCLEDTDMEELPKWTGDLTSLRDLTISRCTGLKGLNEKMRQLTNLRSLQLRYCDSMVSLPHWLGELTSLKRLVLWQCDVLRSLPESIQQLIGLKKLQIVSCHQLKHVVESEEGNMTKLTHNKDRVCLLPSSLEELQIGNCNGIKSLPEGMERLTKLKKLDIRGCPELKQWCEIEENQMKLAHIKEKARISDLDADRLPNSGAVVLPLARCRSRRTRRTEGRPFPRFGTAALSRRAGTVDLPRGRFR
uniref:Uncharacterized protein n=1 Tax=Avena sativa TaxID=4498 RepID=A0ACD5T6L6_AVESA